MRRIIVLGLATIVATLSTALLRQQQTLRQLRREMSSLRGEADEAANRARETTRYSNLLVLARAPQSLPVDPTPELLRLRGQVGLLRRKLDEARSGSNSVLSGGPAQAPDAARTAEALRTLISRQIEIKADLARTTTMLHYLQQLKTAGMKDLRRGIIQSGSDSLLADLSERLALAEEALESTQSRRDSQAPDLQARLATWEDLNRKMEERAEGVLLGLSIKAESEKRVLE